MAKSRRSGSSSEFDWSSPVKGEVAAAMCRPGRRRRRRSGWMLLVSRNMMIMLLRRQRLHQRGTELGRVVVMVTLMTEKKEINEVERDWRNNGEDDDRDLVVGKLAVAGQIFDRRRRGAQPIQEKTAGTPSEKNTGPIEERSSSIGGRFGEATMDVAS